MFYFFLPTLFSYKLILVAAAVIPAFFLMVKVYRSDRLEQESPRMLKNLVIAGILSSLIALVAEKFLCLLLDLLVPKTSVLYPVLLYFVIVAFSEEGAKYFMLQRRTWRAPEFNCQYDAVVYAVFVSLGFALWENISYVMAYGFQTAIVRALTAIPGHACFGVFMGVFYGFAKRMDYAYHAEFSKFFRVLAVLLPAIIHGAYDYIATVDSSSIYFIVFIAILFVISYLLVGTMSKKDRYIS